MIRSVSFRGTVHWTCPIGRRSYSDDQSAPAAWAMRFPHYEFPGAHSVRRHDGVADGQYKLIRFYEPDLDQWELYDLKRDAKEMNSVYDDPQYADVCRRLKAELLRLRRDLEVPMPDPPESYRGGKARYQKSVEAIQKKARRLGIQ